MISWIILAMFCAVIGSTCNFIGINLLIEACDLHGIDAIGMFFIGLLAIIASLAFFIYFTLSCKELFDDWKGE